MNTFNRLIGRRINGILVTPNHNRFAFRTVEGELLIYYTSGDCCNTVYLNHFMGANVVGGNSFDMLRGAVVLGAEEKEWVNVDNEDKESWNVVEDGFFTIRTDRGYIDFEVRNEHNGYYSGHVGEYSEGDLDAGELAEFEPLVDF